MPPSSRLSRLLASLALASALSAPQATGPVAAAASSCSAACVDSDGDGLADEIDGCPTVASGNPTGCPTASRRATLTWLAGKHRLQATITSPVTACSARARIKLWRVSGRRDLKLTSVDASFSGRHRFTVSRGVRYYVTVSPSYASGLAECGRATSRTVLVPRT